MSNFAENGGEEGTLFIFSKSNLKNSVQKDKIVLFFFIKKMYVYISGLPQGNTSLIQKNWREYVERIEF